MSVNLEGLEDYINEQLDPEYWCVVTLVEDGIERPNNIVDIEVEVLWPDKNQDCEHEHDCDCRDSPSFKYGNFDEDWIVEYLGSDYEIENIDSCSTTTGTHFIYRVTQNL